jgi:hypothetical protein
MMDSCGRDGVDKKALRQALPGIRGRAWALRKSKSLRQKFAASQK